MPRAQRAAATRERPAQSLQVLRSAMIESGAALISALRSPSAANSSGKLVRLVRAYTQAVSEYRQAICKHLVAR